LLDLATPVKQACSVQRNIVQYAWHKIADISQGSVATRLKRGGILMMIFITYAYLQLRLHGK